MHDLLVVQSNMPEIYTKEELKRRVQFALETNISSAMQILHGAVIQTDPQRFGRLVTYYGIPALFIPEGSDRVYYVEPHKVIPVKV